MINDNTNNKILSGGVIKKDKKVKKDNINKIDDDAINNMNDDITNENGEIRAIKLIYKYKNNNRKDIFLTYIYVGSSGKNCEKILKKIENLDLFNTIMTLSPDEEIKIKKLLGNEWISKLFNRHHISSFIKKINLSKDLSNKIKIKYGPTWMDEFNKE